MRTIYEQTKTDPQLADKAFLAINEQMKDNLTWLDQAFGRSWKVARVIGGKRCTEPAVYTIGGDGNSYESLVPSMDLGNYSFFVMRDPTRVDNNGDVRIGYSLIMWMNLDNCLSYGRHDTENIKKSVLKCLLKDVWIKNGSISVESVYEDFANVFKGYTLDETEQQYMMHPYCAMRFDGEIKISESCW